MTSVSCVPVSVVCGVRDLAQPRGEDRATLIAGIYAKEMSSTRARGPLPVEMISVLGRLVPRKAYASSLAAIRSRLAGLSSTQRLKALGQQDSGGRTAFTRAVQEGHIETIITLLEGLSPKEKLVALSQQDRAGWTALTMAADRDHVAAIAALLVGLSQEERLIALGQQDRLGLRALTIAAEKGYIAVIAALLAGFSEQEKLKAFTEQDGTNWMALTIAADAGQAAVIADFLAGFSQKERLKTLLLQDGGRWTVLTKAAGAGHVAVIRVCLEGLSPEQQLAILAEQDGDERTALTIAAEGGQEAVVALLRDLGAPLSQYRKFRAQSWLRFINVQWALGLEEQRGIVPICPVSAYDHLIDTIAECKSELSDSSGIAKACRDFEQTTRWKLMPAEQVAQAILDGAHVVIPTGWPGHVTAVVFAKDSTGFLVMKCNRGEGTTDEDTGVSLFTLQADSKPTLAQLTAVIQQLRRKESQAYFDTGINEALGLTPAATTDEEENFLCRAPQKTGNCVFASSKAAFVACLFACCQGNLDQANHFYKEVTARDRMRGLAVVQTTPELSSDPELMALLMEKAGRLEQKRREKSVISD